jgi:hypothetical protein
MDEYLQSLGLSPQELNKVMYHRANMANPGRDAEGRPVTIYATGIKIPSGKFKGQFVSVPGYVEGRIVDNEDELFKIWKKDINAGKWPIYPTSEALNQRDAWLHQVMDRDVNLLRAQQAPAMPLEPAFMYKDPFGAPD